MKKLLLLAIMLLSVVTLSACADESNVVAGDLTPGTYFGFDEDSAYSVTLVVNADGGIEGVFFDALRVKNSVVITRGAAADGSEDTAAVTYTTFSTKQALQEGYTLGSGVMWATEADELAAAIVANQGWNDAWTVIAGTDGDHDLFDVTAQGVIDDISGVTIGVEGFVVAWLEAIGQATE